MLPNCCNIQIQLNDINWISYLLLCSSKLLTLIFQFRPDENAVNQLAIAGNLDHDFVWIGLHRVDTVSL